MILMALGSFFVQVPVSSFDELSLSLGTIGNVIVASLPLAFMGTVGIYILEFPDYNADQIAHKWNLMTLFGRKYGLPIFLALCVLSYISLIAGILIGMIPWIAIFALITIPLVIFASLGLKQLPWRRKEHRAVHRDGHRAYVMIGVIMIARVPAVSLDRNEIVVKSYFYLRSRALSLS